MKARISRGRWSGFDAVILENDQLRLLAVPETGGRIVSLFDKRNGREWLVQPVDSHPARRIDYGTDFNSQSAGGWDEMFPTITADTYPAEKRFNPPVQRSYAGVVLPDHGELWSVPWQVDDLLSDGLEMSVVGRALPYRLARRLTLTESAGVRLRYTLSLLGSVPLFFLWAAHPQFSCMPGTRIVLPEQVKQVINVLPLEWGEEWGPPGTANTWPEKLAADGSSLPQDIVNAPDRRRARKIYLPPEKPINSAGLVQPTGEKLRMSWNPIDLPYCGIWIDEGVLNAVSTVVIEPSQGYYDGLTLAWKNGRVATAYPGVERSWEIAVSLEADLPPVK